MAMKIQLSKPIEAHGETLNVLEMCEPTPADVRAIKALPYAVDQEENVHMRPEIVAKYISRCASIPPSSVDQIDLTDFNEICWVVAGFFLKRGSRTPTT
ncbi:phage tail assembly protein [Burkholderia ambifaria]|uniref:phage tail assembly protein n=1 Tax=Burkholderia ambifaria TaxID=152480 RepID=UPI001E2FBC1E|nr:phage tail assembly protein [Burkholderia ambifaria]UEP49656.1 phage tail assembly protein [Burkholderia ambifaria]